MGGATDSAPATSPRAASPHTTSGPSPATSSTASTRRRKRRGGRLRAAGIGEDASARSLVGVAEVEIEAGDADLVGLHAGLAAEQALLVGRVVDVGGGHLAGAEAAGHGGVHLPAISLPAQASGDHVGGTGRGPEVRW